MLSRKSVNGIKEIKYRLFLKHCMVGHLGKIPKTLRVLEHARGRVEGELCGPAEWGGRSISQRRNQNLESGVHAELGHEPLSIS